MKSAASFLLVFSFFISTFAGAVTLERNLKAWWLMGENARMTPLDVQVLGVTEISSHLEKGVSADGRGFPQLVEGVPFTSFPFEKSFATHSSKGPNYLLVPYDGSFDFEEQSFSVSLWVRADDNGGRYTKLFQKTAGAFWQAETDGGGGVIWNIRDAGGGNAEIQTQNIFAGNSDWHHVLFLRDGANGELRAYVDGQLSINPGGTSGNEGGVGTLKGNGPLGIGAESSGAAPFVGDIDDFRIYESALTQEDALAIYNAGNGDFASITREDELAGWWLMGEDAAFGNSVSETIESVPDHSGNSVPIDAFGAPKRVPGHSFSPNLFAESYASGFSAGPNFLVATSDESFNFADQDFSVSLWARSSNGGGRWKKMFQRQNGGNVFWQAETDGGGGVIWNIRSGNGQNSEIQTNNIFSGNNSWRHLVFLRDTQTQELRAYVDGELSINPGGTAGSEADVNSLAGGGDFGVGAESNGSNPFPGEIDDLRLYDAALSDEDVLAIYNQGMGDLTEPLPFEITKVIKDGDAVIITFRTRPGRVYGVDFSYDLKDWEELDDGVGADAGSDLKEFTDDFSPGQTGKRYYRVRELED